MKLSNAVQFFEDDILGAVPFKDRGAANHAEKARPTQIKLLITVKPNHARELRQAIADDINQPHIEANQNAKF